MTQRHKSAHNRLDYLRTQDLTKRRFASKLSARSLCFLGSVSLLSSGFVLAQTETSVDNIVPTIESSQPITVAEPVKKDTPVSEVHSQPDFAERRVRLRKKLTQENVSQPTKPVRIAQPKVENSQPAVIIRTSKPKVESSEPTVTVRTSKPKVERSQAEKPQIPANSNSAPEKAVEVAKPANNGTTARKNKDYNNSYIDPTDYNGTATGNYEAPSSVVVTERAGGCRAVFSQREIAAGACGKKATDTPRVADSPKKSAPNWIKKSETASLEKAPTAQRVATESSQKTESIVRTVASAVNNKNWVTPKSSTSTHTKTAYRPNRFIPQPSEFSSSTTVSATPIAPSFGTLPAPMAEGKLAPRPSTVSYDFALASVLPQVSYNSTLAYRGGSGMMFPLSVPAPITSLFGWRVHPITGDRRFHAGTDIGAPTGTPILAAAKGQVETANWMGGYGLAVTINHTSAQQSLYGHMSEIFVTPGQWVEPGTVIGRVGSTGNSTGPHLHFEVRHMTQNGWVAVDPGVQLQAGLNNLLQNTRTAQVPQ
ncbi:peptidoglycan DD-metalloendopeptidase family protein [Anabaena cylindrica FACHB-243]|uniref:Peptidase M23 n=1 Tax=Anabaena cylindrica (strain ATCC 27899 / PCC 7122) TaxID=272123 RepID=K9ZDL5_ANACC|nr:MULTISPECIES: peptidoglycan DD-metalloendopeptidase family protein [Anabaena]AFZ57303.1 Peptidase M23 [Anabaena cylindrica PCC 7122]MBD2420971.1 peptidoglycan DD-metalloendopeptidase family protein [Anabaena cylindrica FACHB-243]MBY5283428.1 peptidoglycan DD-metalloendopeptidase family protein [Anabaena sp. CCAP 1446/1C]MBY5311281.1 peptidoglycan DD-metalloendopeptidase family protein [Anabaena sp. CCAP 1446/1C]MCM2405724.1 peptidoglycan DD-metalloendopeptidase family protein [Anabaena sp. 